MVQYRLGYFATSLCGHDKGRIYMIVSEEGEMVGLCDGIHRCLDNPKRKKKKHVQMIRDRESAESFQELIQAPDADERIRRAVQHVSHYDIRKQEDLVCRNQMLLK